MNSKDDGHSGATTILRKRVEAGTERMQKPLDVVHKSGESSGRGYAEAVP